MLSLKMLTSIYLDDQQYRVGIKVNDIWTNGFLQIELDTEDLLSTQARPEQLLGIGKSFAQFAGNLF